MAPLAPSRLERLILAAAEPGHHGGMASTTESSHHMRLQRVPLIIRLLQAGPLPGEVITSRLQPLLQQARLPLVEDRTVKHDLAWILEHLTPTVERVPRSALGEEVPSGLERHRWFYRIQGAENLIPVEGSLLFLSELEALALVAARAQLALPPGADGRSADPGPLAASIDRLLVRLGLSIRDERIPDILAMSQIPPQAYDPDVALTLLRAIRCGDAVHLAYQSRGKAPRTTVIQPARLVLIEAEPYCYAWDPSAALLKTYKLSRMGEVVRRPALPGVPTDLQTRVREHLLGTFRGMADAEKAVTVTIRVTPRGVPFLRDRRLGTGQSWQDMPDGGARITFRTRGLDALKHYLLQFGRTVVVETPATLAGEMREEIETMADAYHIPLGP
jgi:predicted DNA-binding transcriptional regulator YafY